MASECVQTTGAELWGQNEWCRAKNGGWGTGRRGATGPSVEVSWAVRRLWWPQAGQEVSGLQTGRQRHAGSLPVIPSAPGVPQGNSDCMLSTDGQEILLLGYSNPK